MDGARARRGDRLRDGEPGRRGARLPLRLPGRLRPARARKRRHHVPELVDGEVDHRVDLRPRDEPAAGRSRRPARLPDPRRRRGPRRDHDARPADDDQRPAVERPARLQHPHAGPDRRGAHGPGREGPRHLLGVLAERPRAGRRGDPERGRRGLPGLRPARAARPDRDRAGHVALAARLGGPHPGVLRRPHGSRRLRPPRRADAPRRRVERAAAAVEALHARVDRPDLRRTAATAGSSGSTRPSPASARGWSTDPSRTSAPSPPSRPTSTSSPGSSASW